MITAVLAGAVTFLFTALLAIAGLGAAFILIPVFIALGIDLHEAMATALLLNTIAISFASVHFIRNGLVMWRIALPILVAATAAAPLGAYVSVGLNREVLLWMFSAFLIFSSGMMIFYSPRPRTAEIQPHSQLGSGIATGTFAGFLGGLLGVGGGGFIVPVLVWLGYDVKKVSATTSVIVIFSSFSGFLGHIAVGGINPILLGMTAIGSALGAIVGARLMTGRLNQKQVKQIIGIVLMLIAAKMVWGLLN